MRHLVRGIGGGPLLWALAASACRSGVDRPGEASTAARVLSASEWSGDDGLAAAGDSLDAATLLVPKEAWVLHIGDSFVDASFKQNLAPRFRGVGARYVVRSTTATYTTTWAYSPELDAMLARRPALVVVTLGANEFDITSPEQHARPIEIIARKIARAGAACVWTSPPMWTADTGIVQVIHDHCAPCLFFDSDAVLGGLSSNERGGDRIHPNKQGGGRWAAAFWDWLTRHRDPAQGPWALTPFERR
jgi:lysophospholipase L1-like esterase